MILRHLSNSNPPLPTIDKSAQAENIWQVHKRSPLPHRPPWWEGPQKIQGCLKDLRHLQKLCVCVYVCVCVWQLRHTMAKCPSEGAQRMRTEVRKKSQVANKKISMSPRLEYEECAECLFVVRQEIRTKIGKFLEPRENETLPFTWCSCCYDLKVKLSGEVKGRHWGSPVPFKDRVPSCTGKEARLRQDWVFV